MSREWKPGDVAVVDGPGKRLPITFFANEDHDGVMFNNGAGYQHSVRHLARTARPLVVIDPEDREQAERLAKALHELNVGEGKAAPWGDQYPSWRATRVCHMQAALREFANPTPPKEPTGLGAVVEDDDAQWVHFGNGCWIKTVPNASLQHRSWDDFSVGAVVLSEGVQA